MPGGESRAHFHLVFHREMTGGNSCVRDCLRAARAGMMNRTLTGYSQGCNLDTKRLRANAGTTYLREYSNATRVRYQYGFDHGIFPVDAGLSPVSQEPGQYAEHRRVTREPYLRRHGLRAVQCKPPSRAVPTQKEFGRFVRLLPRAEVRSPEHNQEDSMRGRTAECEASASSGIPQHWHQIDWRRVERNVRGMQVRIAKATREGNWRKMKALQRMLTRSFSAKA